MGSLLSGSVRVFGCDSRKNSVESRWRGRCEDFDSTTVCEAVSNGGFLVSPILSPKYRGHAP